MEKIKEKLKFARLKILIFVGLSSVSIFILAFSETPIVKYYDSDNVTNQIPYFDNRFRIDAELDEVKLVFYRKRGSQPVILVQPDGSKLRVNNLPEDNTVEWFDDKTYDMIRIEKPMPGPWQVIGEVLPGSQILVVSDVVIAVEPLPDIILSGETLKMTGKLINGDKALNDPSFREVVELTVDFFSTNNSEYDNFGAVPIQLTTFRDDGLALDEHANDGLYTGEFTLEFAPGEWIPIYTVKMPMATRELRQNPIILQAAPISITVDKSEVDGGEHIIHFKIDPACVDPDSILLQGKITFPDRQEEPFSVMQGSGKERIKKIRNTESGIYRITVSVFGKTINGREFHLTIPEYVFNAEPIELIVPTLNDVAGEIESIKIEETAQARERILSLEIEAEKQKKIAEMEKEQQEMIITIVIVNIVIIIIAVVIYFLRTRRKLKSEKV